MTPGKTPHHTFVRPSARTTRIPNSIVRNLTHSMPSGICMSNIRFLLQGASRKWDTISAASSFTITSSRFPPNQIMPSPERRRRHSSLLLSMLWLSPSESFQSATIPCRRERKVSRQPSYDQDKWLKVVPRKMVSKSMDVPPTSSPNMREIEQEIVKLGRSGKTEEALLIYSQLERPSIRLLNTAIDACSRAKPTRLKEAFEMFQAGVEGYGLIPNVFTFGVLMNACNRDRNANKALALLATMKVSFQRIFLRWTW